MAGMQKPFFVLFHLFKYSYFEIRLNYVCMLKTRPREIAKNHGEDLISFALSLCDELHKLQALDGHFPSGEKKLPNNQMNSASQTKKCRAKIVKKSFFNCSFD